MLNYFKKNCSANAPHIFSAKNVVILSISLVNENEVLVNRLGGLSLPRKSVVRLTDRPDMALDVYRGRKTTIQQHSEREVKFQM